MVDCMQAIWWANSAKKNTHKIHNHSNTPLEIILFTQDIYSTQAVRHTHYVLHTQIRARSHGFFFSLIPCLFRLLRRTYGFLICITCLYHTLSLILFRFKLFISTKRGDEYIRPIYVTLRSYTEKLTQRSCSSRFLTDTRATIVCCGRGAVITEYFYEFRRLIRFFGCSLYPDFVEIV